MRSIYRQLPRTISAEHERRKIEIPDTLCNRTAKQKRGPTGDTGYGEQPSTKNACTGLLLLPSQHRAKRPRLARPNTCGPNTVFAHLRCPASSESDESTTRQAEAENGNIPIKPSDRFVTTFPYQHLVYPSASVPTALNANIRQWHS